MSARSSIHDDLPVLLPRLWAFALRLCGDAHRAEVLVERAYEAGITRWHRESAMPPLVGMMSAMCDVWSHEWPRRDASRPADPEFGEPAFDAQALDDAANASGEGESRSIRQAVGELPDVLRVPLLLIKVERLKYNEAAAVLKLSSRTLFDLVEQATHAVEMKLNGGAHRESAAAQPAAAAGETPAVSPAKLRPAPLEQSWTSCSGVAKWGVDRYIFPNYNDPSRE